MCLDAGVVHAAEIVDHIVPHRGERELIADFGAAQPRLDLAALIRDREYVSASRELGTKGELLGKPKKPALAEHQ